MNFKSVRRFLDAIDPIVDAHDTLIYSAINVFSGFTLFYCICLGLNDEANTLTRLVGFVSAAGYGASYGTLLRKKD